MSGGHYIVVATFTDPADGVYDDEWQVFETYDEAVTAYDSVIENDAYSASICAVLESTDFTPHPLRESLR